MCSTCVSNNSSQLAGFTKASDLPYFLDALLSARYEHEPLLAPTPELLAAGRKAKTAEDWQRFECDFLQLMRDRAVQDALARSSYNKRTARLCSQPTPEHCHRRLVAAYLSERWPDLSIVDL